MEVYGNIKTKIFAHQTKDDFAVLNYDDELVRGYADKLTGTVVFFSRKENLADLKFAKAMFVEDGKMVWLQGGVKQEIIPVDEILIKGPHNLENALAAATMAVLAGVDSARTRGRVWRRVVHQRLEGHES
jgi:UDP-N-acetylmuramoylalanine--D-glutamate ligase